MYKKLIRTYLLALIIVGIAAAAANASGTLAGTMIRNSATVSYKDANSNPMTSVTSNEVITEVDSVFGVDISPNGYPVAGFSESKTRDFVFTVTNTGNDLDMFALAVTGIPAGWGAVIYHDADGDGILDAGEPTTSNTGSLDPNPPTLPASTNYEYFIIVRVTAPAAPVVVNNIATFTLTAISAGSASVTDTASFSMEVEQAEIAVSKTAELANPMPLEPFDYTISVTNSGTVQAYDVVVSDALPSGISFRGPVLYDADGAGALFSPVILAGAYSMGTVTVNIGSLGAGITATISFEAEVTAEIPAGTGILNSAGVTYDDWNDYHFISANSSTVTVKIRGGVNIESSRNAYVDPGDVLQIPFTIENTGNGTDDMIISATHNDCNLSLTWTILWDSDEDGTYETTVGTTSGSDNMVGNTGPIAKDDVYSYVATASIPVGTADTLFNKVVIWASSTKGPIPFMSDGITLINIVKSPTLTLVKQVDKQNSVPGEILTYTLTVTNTGTGDALTVLIQDSIDLMKDSIDFIASSIRVDNVPQTDALDSDYADFAANVVTVRIPQIGGTLTLPLKTSYVITFQVRVK